MPAYTSPDNIQYPVSTDQVAPLETVFANLAQSTQNALTAVVNQVNDQLQIHTYRWANAGERTAQTGMAAGDLGYQMDTDVIYLYQGAAWKAWESDWRSYSPTITGFTVGTGGSQSIWMWKYEGGRVKVKYTAVRGSSGASTSNVRFTLPTNRATDVVNYNRVAGSGVAAGPSSSFYTSHSMNNTSVNQVRVLYLGGSGEAEITSSAPFAWGTGSWISGEIEYDPA